MKYVLMLSASLLVFANVSQAEDATTMPSTLPATVPVAPATMTAAPMVRGKALPDGYAVLNTRSIFMKGRVAPPVVPNVTTTQPVVTPTIRPEHKIVFVGVTESDGSAAAMFEDTAAGKIITTKLNETIASGKVTEITLDSVTYSADGKPLKVLVGQALDGTEPPPVTARATITDSSTGPPTTGPTAAPGGGESGPTDPAIADILERMRARRRAGQ